MVAKFQSRHKFLVNLMENSLHFKGFEPFLATGWTSLNWDKLKYAQRF